MADGFDYILGADLGKTVDPASFVLLKRYLGGKPGHASDGKGDLFCVVAVEVMDLGTTYPLVIERLETICSHEKVEGRVWLVFDKTGVGGPVADYVYQSDVLKNIAWGVVISSGQNVTQDGTSWKVPKKDLVGAVQIGMQERRLEYHPNLPGVGMLKQQLLDFRVEKTVRGASLFEGKGQTHDDLVMALGVAVWASEKLELAQDHRNTSNSVPYTIIPGRPSGTMVPSGMPSWRPAALPGRMPPPDR